MFVLFCYYKQDSLFSLFYMILKFFAVITLPQLAFMFPLRLLSLMLCLPYLICR